MATQTALLPSRRLALRAFIGSILVSALLGIMALLAGDFGELQVKVLLSSLSVSAASLTVMAGAAVVEARGARALGVPAVVLSGVALVLVLMGIWGEIGGDEYWKLTSSACFFAAAFAHSSLLWLARLAPNHRWLQIGTVALSMFLAAYGAALIWGEVGEEAAYRFLGVLSILLAAGTLATPVVHRLDAAPKDRSEEPRQETRLGGAPAPDRKGQRGAPVSMLCPICSVHFEHALGDVECPRCGVRFTLDLEAP